MRKFHSIGPLLALCCTVAATQLAAQDVLIIDAAGGPGSQFTDLPQAVAAAAPGDILDVVPGFYTGFETSKGIHILGRAGGDIDIVGRSSNGFAFSVSNLPANQPFTLRNLKSSSFFTGGAEFIDCAGSIVLDSCLVNVLMGQSSSQRLEFLRCPSAHLFGCTIAIDAEQSNVTLTDRLAEICTFAPFLSPILLRNAHLTLSRSTSRAVENPFAFDPLPGIVSFDSDIVFLPRDRDTSECGQQVRGPSDLRHRNTAHRPQRRVDPSERRTGH